MPMSFPTHEHVLQAAANWKFRQPLPEETEQQYRDALAAHVKPKDIVEANEIRTGKSWNKWTDEEKLWILS